MKTHKKRILIATLLCCLFLLLSACGVQNASQQIIGTWTPSIVKGVLGGESSYLDAKNYDEIGMMTFNPDGTMSGFDSATMENYEGWHWQIKGERLITSNGIKSWEYTILRLDKNLLVVRVELGDLEGYGFEPGDYLESVCERLS